MRFVYFGYDYMIGGVRHLLDQGHTMLGVCTFECDNIFNFNRQTIQLAQERSVPVYAQQPTNAHIQQFLNEGAQVFLSAGYIYKIPPIPEDRAYGVNLHPSLLPKARGLMPVPYIILNQPDAGGLTLHKLTQKFDQGDILMQRPIKLHANETVEMYGARVSMAAPAMLSTLFENIDELWENALPQDEKLATYYPPPTDQMRFINWDGPVDQIDRIGRAFGRFGALTEIDGQIYAIYSCDIWKENHNHKPGTIVHVLSREMIVAAADGYVCLKDIQRLDGQPQTT